MANPGVGSKFVSVNLNKSYGQQQQRSSSSGNLGGGASRIHRSGGGNGLGSGNGGGGGGGGMVVLSRSRSSIVGVQKGGPKLSVPPPLNLPSLRKEHERSDSSSSGGGSAGAGNSGVGARPTSSGMGWTKPAPSLLQEKDSGNDHPLSGVGSPMVNVNDPSRGNNVYMPPSARTGISGPSVAVPTHDYTPVQRAVVLRGEDFPSLQATLPVATGVSQKQKDSLNQKQNQKVSADSDEQMGNSYLRPPFVMQPQNQSSRLIGKVPDDKEGVNHKLGGSRSNEQLRKQDDFFPSPLPLVRLNHTSDWADDERDTGHGIPDRDRDQGYSRNEFSRDRDFDFPRASVPPRTLIHDHSEGRSLRHDEAGRPPSGGYLRGNTYNRDVRSPSREARDGSSWRASSLMKVGFSGDRNGIGGRPLGNRENGNDNKFGQSHFGDGARDGFNSGLPGAQDSRFGRRDVGYGQGIRQAGNYVTESYSGRGVEQTKPEYYGGDLPNRNRGDSFQNGSLTKTSGRGLFLNDPVPSIGREKRLTSGKQYSDEPFLKDFGSGPDFDGRDPLTGTLVGVSKRKKDVLKQTDYYHDPVRESFEAELERVQKLQEQERQRVIDEQARALELARKEEEERERVAREEEERRRRLEEELREAARRAEQERLEAARRAEEQKVAREDEKRRMMLEEERRKEAARKKLLELEERIARRQAEVSKENEFSSAVRDDRMPGMFHEKDVPRTADVVDWEDGERMVERITSSASSDSSGLNRSFEMSSRPPFYRDADSAFLDRGRPSNSWRRDAFENVNNSNFIWQDQDNGYRSPKRDTYGAGRTFGRKEFNGGPGTMPTKVSARGGFPEPLMDDLPQPRVNRWNLSGEGDPYSRNSDADPEFHDNFIDKFNDIGWGFGRPRATQQASYPERMYQSSDTDGFSSFGKSRHSMRQPRVLPPPSLNALNKNTFRSQIDPPSSSDFPDREMNYHHAPRKGEPVLQTGYEASYQEDFDQPRTVGSQKENLSCPDQKGAKATTPRCDSQSSLSVSSPPSSPTHLSHDDPEEDSGESPISPTAAEGKEVNLSDHEHDFSMAEVSTIDKVGPSSSISAVEDEEWDIENRQDLTEQEEYDDEENGFREEDEVHEGDDENDNLRQDIEDLYLEEKDYSSKKDQLVLAFDESENVVIPSVIDLEESSRNIGSQQVSEEAESLDGLVGAGQNLQSENDSPKLSTESPKMTDEAGKTLVDMGIQSVSTVDSTEVPVNLVHSSEASAGYVLDSVEVSSSLSAPPLQPLTASVEMTLPSSTTQMTTSTVSSGPSQTDVPVKLQFGLFSGPSLIPSPVQAIQIGSIQMPLHLHHQVGPSLTQLQPSQPPFFQFGQLRYASPISQGILPLGPQSMSFIQPSVPASYLYKQNQDGSISNQEGKDPYIQSNSSGDKLPSVSVDNNFGVQKLLDQSQDPCEGVDVLSVSRGAETEVIVSNSRAESSLRGERHMGSESISQVDPGYQYFDGKKNYRSNVNNTEWQGQFHSEPTTSQFMSKAPGPMSGNRGKRYVYTVKNSGSRSSLPVSESQYTEFRGPQRRTRSKLPRTEFRVRENFDKRQREAASSKYPETEKSSFNGKVFGTSVHSGVKEADGTSESKMEKQLDKDVSSRKGASLYISHSREGNSKRNNNFDEDVDAPLQSGIVRVFKQPGIEAPSDEDDFIEVRSKRQMLNDRREQREKEIKAKSRLVKVPRKHRSVSQNNATSAISSKTSTPLGREASNSTYSKSVISDGQSLERPTRFTNSIVSPPLAPIGTPSANPSVNADGQIDIRPYTTKSPQTGSVPVISNNGTSLVPSLSFENKNMLLDSVPTSLSPWGNTRINQQVMALTQTQLDEAMKPARFEKHVASIGDRTSAVIESSKLSSTIVVQDKSFSSTASPLNSLLAGEKIQFGAVTSPTIFPCSSHVVSSGMGPPDSCRSDVPIDHNLSALENDCSLFFEKDKHLNESCVDLEDSEAEAEAAASAVAVAAISSDEIVGSGCSVSVSEAKGFGGAENEGLASEGGASNLQIGSQSRGEESLSVALPADLSVETPSLSLWPSLPSPQHSSGQMLPHFPGGPPSHFPCYEMNPMLGGPIFAFGPHDETAGTQSQSQKSSASGAGPLGAWQQCHSGVDSFYGPPAGFTGPFIGPSGGIPGVQGPPHMVVYNHFTPVGQFGQVGLSFMGTTYIPSGKQPDWKHNPASSAMGMGEGDINNLNIPSAHSQHNPAGMPTPIQHLAPGSPLLPMASPLAMFDMSPFQSSGDVPVQARWSHFSASPLHSAPLSMPLPQHAESVVPSQFSHGSNIDQTTSNRFHEASSTMSDSGRNFSGETGSTTTQFPDELGLMDTSSTTTSRVSVSRPASYSSTIMNGKNLSRSTATTAGDASSINNNSNQSANSSVKSQSGQQQTSLNQQYHHSSGYNDQRGGSSQRVASGGEWSHRRMGSQGRNQSYGTDKKVPAASKVKQIYVAKQPQVEHQRKFE